ncbi:arylsulfatase [Abditibacteriota bacterium]|nr:arylsulfatase [Abditibacteriota bacterium]
MKPSLHTGFVLSSFLFAPLLTASCKAAEPVQLTKPNAPSLQRPNIVVLLADDMGWADIGCYGGEISTPNLDRLASGGLRFTQFYNCARCSPSRASLMTGLYPHEAGMGYLDDLVLPDSKGTRGRLSDRAVTMGEVLKQNGYFTAMTGKWHMGQKQGTGPWQRGFDRSLNSAVGGIYFPNQKDPNDKNLYLNGQPVPLESPVLGKDWYSSDLWTNFSLKFVDEALQNKKPFFLYQAFCAPHFPLMAPKQDIARYKGKFLKGWDQLREERYRRQIGMKLIDPKWPLSQRPPDSPAWASLSAADKELFDQKMAVYAAMIDNLDQNVGKLVDGLKKRGVLNNTLILFMSDNGGNAESGPRGVTEGDELGSPQSRVFLGMNWATLANTPFRRYKHFIHEGGISTPLIAHWPAGIPKGRDGALEKQPGHLVDIMATVMDATKSKYPATFHGNAIHPMDGVSLLPAFQGKALKRPNPIFWEHEGNRGVRSGKWKLVSKFLDQWELYDIEADRTEQHNLASANPDLVRDLTARWDKWAGQSFVDQWQGPRRSDWGDPVPEDSRNVGSKAMMFDLKPNANLAREQAPRVANRNIDITANLGARHENGVIVAQGGAQVGYALYLKAGMLEVATRVGGQLTVVTAPEALPAGAVTVGAQLTRDGALTLLIGAKTVATGKAPTPLRTMPVDGLQVGRDLAGLVGNYQQENDFDGVIERVSIELKD